MKKKNIQEIYRHIYDDNKESDGSEKPNEFLGKFEIIEGNTDGYDFEAIGLKKGKKYKIFGQEISSLQNYYKAGTKCFIELIEE